MRKAEERAHILEGLIIASDNIDEVIALIRSSSNADEARAKLIERFALSEIQARAIVENAFTSVNWPRARQTTAE